MHLGSVEPIGSIQKLPELRRLLLSLFFSRFDGKSRFLGYSVTYHCHT